MWHLVIGGDEELRACERLIADPPEEGESQDGSGKMAAFAEGVWVASTVLVFVSLSPLRGMISDSHQWAVHIHAGGPR